MTIKTALFDAAEYLDSPEAIQAFLADAKESGDPDEFIRALGVAARAVGMSEVAQKAGLGREGLYKALREGGNASFQTVEKVVRALGVKLDVGAAA